MGPAVTSLVLAGASVAPSAAAATAPYTVSLHRADCSSDGSSLQLTATITVTDPALDGQSAEFQSSPRINAAGDSDPWIGNFIITSNKSQTVTLHRVYSPETVYPGTQTAVGTAFGTGSANYGPVPADIAACPPAPKDTTAPVTTGSPLSPYSLASSQTWSYKATDSGSGVANYDVRTRTAPYNGGFSSYSYPSTWQHRTTTSVSHSLPRGTTVCFNARARDKAGNVSAWTADHCTAAALDDASLSASTGWTRGRISSYYAGTYSKAAKTGVTLTRTGLRVHRLALVATKCHGCGTVGAYWNGKLLKTISLSASSTALRQTFAITNFSGVNAGTLVLKTLNKYPVYIDGLALNRA